MPKLASIRIYPLKSCDAMVVGRAQVLPSGALANDRRWALVDGEGQVVNGKRTPAFHRLRAEWGAGAETIRLRIEGSDAWHTFDMTNEREALEHWLSDYLELSVSLIENREAGFPDDTVAPGPTVIATATLSAIAGWFGLSTNDVRLRFRANLEIDGVEPFWEDHLYAQAGAVVRFRIGPVELLGTNPCQRCIVPTRDPTGGGIIGGFAKKFSAMRKDSLPFWAAADRFDHFYRLAVNTRVAVPGTLAVGDEVTIVGVESRG